jgi:hypothetical protein
MAISHHLRSAKIVWWGHFRLARILRNACCALLVRFKVSKEQPCVLSARLPITVRKVQVAVLAIAYKVATVLRERLRKLHARRVPTIVLCRKVQLPIVLHALLVRIAILLL